MSLDPGYLYGNNAAKARVLRELRVMLSRHGSQNPVILDVACGQCDLWPPFLDEFSEVQFHGVDLNPEAVLSAQRALPKHRDRLVIGRGEEANRFFTGLFDIVVSVGSLEHVKKRRKFLRAIRDILRPGGIFLLTYDSGHFLGTSFVEKGKNVLSRVVAVGGWDRNYRKWVNERWVTEVLDRELGFSVLEKRYYNAYAIKNITKSIRSEAAREEIFRIWSALEDRINDLVPSKDRLWPGFHTTYFKLMRNEP